MQYNYRYRLDPPDALAETLLRHVDTCRQLYNHVPCELNESDDIPARYEVQGTLPGLNSWWDDLNDVHSKVLQMVVKRVCDDLSTLKARKENGRAVGPVDTPVSAKRVVETGSPTLKERTASAVSE